MKKIFMTIVAVAAIAACSKTEVQYENSAEIGFAPAVKNVTKGAMTGVLATVNPDQKLGIWAYWNYKDGAVRDSHDQLYLNDATFKNKTVTYNDGSNDVTTSAFWAGENYAYPWPLNGTLRFAGYTKPANDVSVSYSGVEGDAGDKITFTNYTQVDGFDLCWFSATGPENNRTSGAAIPVTLSHALSWLKFNIMGDGTAGWKINSIVLNDIANTGTGVCKGEGANKASWTCSEYATDITLRNTELVLTNQFVDIETVTAGNTSNDFLVIPQTINPSNKQDNARTQHTLTINYSFPVGDPNVEDNWKSDTKTVKLDLSGQVDGVDIPNEWQSGIKYVYNLTFKSNQILVSPSYGGWDTTVSQGVIIE